MLSSVWYYDWEYWNLYHKVTFDGIAKIIHVNDGVTALNWKNDVYSAWKEWAELVNHDNLAFLQAMRSTGGDYITSDGTRRVGGTFFLMNGWRLKTWSGTHRLVIEGNVYTEEGDPIYIPHDGNFGVVIEQTLSSLVETVTTQGAGTGTGTTVVPTPSEIAGAVWDTNAISYVQSGSFGQFMNMIKAMTESTANDVAIMKPKLDTATALIQTLLKYQSNRTKIDQTAKTMTVYQDDGVTVLKVFDLKDFTGTSSITQVAERVPQ
jgi:hypothetical protein